MSRPAPVPSRAVCLTESGEKDKSTVTAEYNVNGTGRVCRPQPKLWPNFGSMRRARGIGLQRAAFLQEHVSEMGQRVGHDFGLLVLGRKQDQFGEGFDDHRGQLGEIGIAALDAFAYELVDVAMQAVGHFTSAWSVRSRDSSRRPPCL